MQYHIVLLLLAVQFAIAHLWRFVLYPPAFVVSFPVAFLNVCFPNTFTSSSTAGRVWPVWLDCVFCRLFGGSFTSIENESEVEVLSGINRGAVQWPMLRTNA